MPREDLVLIAQVGSHIREMLTIDVDHLPSVFELAVKSNPPVSTHGEWWCGRPYSSSGQGL
jgi:hypothetical protein